MKKTNQLLKSLLIGLMLLPVLAAAEETYPVTELKDHTQSEWNETYQAYGRTIEVSVPINIPEAETAPVIAVEKVMELTNEQVSRLNEIYTAPEGEEYKYDLRLNENSIQVGRNIPDMPDKNESENWDDLTQRIHALLQYSEGEAYADANPLTVGEALQIMTAAVRDVNPDIDLAIKNIALYDRYRVAKTDESIQEKGYYRITKETRLR